MPNTINESKAASWSALDPQSFDRSRVRRFKNNAIAHNVTGLNPKAQIAFKDRMKEILGKFGITEDVSWGRSGEGKIILISPTPNIREQRPTSMHSMSRSQTAIGLARY